MTWPGDLRIDGTMNLRGTFRDRLPGARSPRKLYPCDAGDQTLNCSIIRDAAIAVREGGGR